jgi:hypothetical protein
VRERGKERERGREKREREREEERWRKYLILAAKTHLFISPPPLLSDHSIGFISRIGIIFMHLCSSEL